MCAFIPTHAGWPIKQVSPFVPHAANCRPIPSVFFLNAWVQTTSSSTKKKAKNEEKTSLYGSRGVMYLLGKKSNCLTSVACFYSLNKPECTIRTIKCVLSTPTGRIAHIAPRCSLKCRCIVATSWQMNVLFSFCDKWTIAGFRVQALWSSGAAVRARPRSFFDSAKKKKTNVSFLRNKKQIPHKRRKLDLAFRRPDSCNTDIYIHQTIWQ